MRTKVNLRLKPPTFQPIIQNLYENLRIQINITTNPNITNGKSQNKENFHTTSKFSTVNQIKSYKLKNLRTKNLYKIQYPP